jgi:hypothetical protein
MSSVYVVEARVNDIWHDAFHWQPAFETREEAEEDLREWLCDTALHTGMNNNPENYRVSEIKKWSIS